MKKVRLGIIGFGRQGGYYAEFLAAGDVANTEIGAICDIDPQKKQICEKVYKQIPFFTHYTDLLESKTVDAIITCVPHYLHPEIGIAALKRGIHILVEKPAGVYSKQVRELNACAATYPELTFGIMFNQRTNPLYQKIKTVIDNGQIGNIRRANWLITNWYRPQAYYDQSAWRATWQGEGGGVLVNQAPHQIDMMQWLCGMPKKVWSNVKYGYQRNITVEDDVTAVFDYGNGATGVFITCTHDYVGTDRLEILGDSGKIIVDNSNHMIIKRLPEREQEINARMTDEDVTKIFKCQFDATEISEEIIEFDSKWENQHKAVIENFSANILNGTPLLAPGSDGINGVILANAIHLSSWLGKEIEIPFDEELYVAELKKRIAIEKND